MCCAFRLRSVYVEDTVVGAVCCRVESGDPAAGYDRLYIMTLGVTATWRRRGIGSQLLRHVLGNLTRHPSIRVISLHVQTTNVEAVGFYKVKRQA